MQCVYKNFSLASPQVCAEYFGQIRHIVLFMMQLKCCGWCQFSPTYYLFGPVIYYEYKKKSKC